MPEQEPDYFTAAQVARKLGVTRQAVYQWIANGVMPHLKIGDVIRIPRDFEQTLKERQSAAKSPAAS
jgi:excisionase family DNA binding protein